MLGEFLAKQGKRRTLLILFAVCILFVVTGLALLKAN